MKPSEQLNLTGIGITVLVLIGIALFVDISDVRGYIEEAGAIAPLLVVLLKASTVVFVPLSGGPVYPIVGALFGFWPGILYVALGDFLGYTIAFFLSRKLGLPVLKRFFDAKEDSVLARIMRHAGTPKGFFQMCLTFGAMPELIAYGGGLSKIRYPVAMAIMMPLSLIGSTIFVFFGATLGADGSLGPALILPLAAFFIMALGGWFFLRAILKKDPTLPKE